MTTYAVTGATGKLGRLVLDELLQQADADDVVALARDPSALADYAAKGVQVRRADYDDPASVDAALEGVDRVLLLQHAGLSGVSRNGSGLTIGAMTPVAELEDAPEPLATTARHVADPEIRAQATLGGNVCAPAGGESPRGDLQAALIALGAKVRSAGKGGERSEPVEDFLASGPEGRLLVEIELEEPTRAASAVVRRPHAHAYTVLAVCAAETSKGVRVGITGAGPHGVGAPSVEQALAGGASTEEAAQKSRSTRRARRSSRSTRRSTRARQTRPRR